MWRGCVDKSEWSRIGGLAARLVCCCLLLMQFWGIVCTSTDTQTHMKRFRLPPTTLSWNSAFPASAACVSVCVKVMLTQPPTAATKDGRRRFGSRRKSQEKTFFTPARTAAPKQTGGYFSKFVFFFLLFHCQSPREADECGKIRDSSVRAGLLEAGTGGEGA